MPPPYRNNEKNKEGVCKKPTMAAIKKERQLIVALPDQRNHPTVVKVIE
jgi:hypothetical protein